LPWVLRKSGGYGQVIRGMLVTLGVIAVTALPGGRMVADDPVAGAGPSEQLAASASTAGTAAAG